MKDNPLVSINIRTYNSAKTLPETLESVRRQTYKRIETLISDGFSRDNSVKIAKSFGAHIHYAGKLGDARYQGLKKSRGAYVLSLDSDQVLDSDLIEACVELCERKKFDAVTIAEQSIVQKNTLVERLIAYDKWLIDKTRSTDPLFGTACPRFFRKSILDKIDWPDALSIFDDTILYAHLLKLGARVGYISKPCLRHHEVSSFGEVFRKFYRYGKGYFEALKSNPTTIAVHSLPRASYFRKEALTKPHYLFGLLLLYGVKASGATLGAISSIAKRLS